MTLVARSGRWYRIAEQAGQGRVVSVWTDVTDLVQRERALQAAYSEVVTLSAKLREQAETDSLTKLPHRRKFEAVMAQAQAWVDAGQTLALALVDIDHLKAVNDRFGHDVGDEVLVEVGRRMKESLNARDTLARLGGEEFGVLFAEADLPEASSRASTMLDAVRTMRYEVAGTELIEPGGVHRGGCPAVGRPSGERYDTRTSRCSRPRPAGAIACCVAA